MISSELFELYTGQTSDFSCQDCFHDDGHVDHTDSDSTPGYEHIDRHSDLFN